MAVEVLAGSLWRMVVRGSAWWAAAGGTAARPDARCVRQKRTVARMAGKSLRHAQWPQADADSVDCGRRVASVATWQDHSLMSWTAVSATVLPLVGVALGTAGVKLLQTIACRRVGR